MVVVEGAVRSWVETVDDRGRQCDAHLDRPDAVRQGRFVTLGGVVVAAGRGERFGRPKALVEVGGVARVAASRRRAGSSGGQRGRGGRRGSGRRARRRPSARQRRRRASPPFRQTVNGCWCTTPPDPWPAAVTGQEGGGAAAGRATSMRWSRWWPVRDTIKRTAGGLVVETVDRSASGCRADPAGLPGGGPGRRPGR